MIDNSSIFAAVRRGYSEFQSSSPEDICEYFNSLDEESLSGDINNIKGIIFEQEIVDFLNENGVPSALFEATNHPDSDIFLFDDSEIISEFQLKATDSVQYIAETLEENPDIPIIATTEVASSFDSNEMVIDSGISNEDLIDFVTESISGGTAEIANDSISDSINESIIENVVDFSLPIPFSPFWLLGLPF